MLSVLSSLRSSRMLTGVFALLVATSSVHAQSQTPPPDACAGLLGQTVPASAIGLPSGDATVDSALMVAATPQSILNGAAVPGRPDYCEVLGSIGPLDPAAPPIRFQINLPVVWNGTALQYGGGGFNGTLTTGLDPLRDDPPDAALPITRGYATYGTDSGHDATAYLNTDLAAFALNDEALTNFAYASYKKVNDVARSVIRSYYGQTPARTYYFGGSEGGREGLTMAQRFPNDYDGIVSVVPVINWVGLQHAYLPNQLAQTNEGWINPNKAFTLTAAVNKACDSLDGLADGVVNNYLACPANFDPQVVRCADGVDNANTCLSDEQIRAFQIAHQPYVFPFTVVNGVSEYPQFLYGGEYTPGGLNQWVEGTAPPTVPLVPDTSRWWLFGNNTIRFFIARDATFDVRYYDPTAYAARIQEVSRLMDSTDPDLSAFFAHGGKLIMRENMGDYAQSPLAGIRYYSSVVAQVGQPTIDQHARLYVSPASSHGGTMKSVTDQQDVPTWVDLLDPLDQWVVTGQAPPDVLTQVRRRPVPPFETLATRPMCQYPDYPQYTGGDRLDAGSFQCAPSGT